MIFSLFITLIVLVRFAELAYAARNEKILRKKGAVEFGREHYPLMIVLHTAFFCAMILEYLFLSDKSFSMPLILLFFILLLFKFRIIYVLGPYWNTKILRLPGTPLVTRFPYNIIKHPNYLIVVCEIAVIPLAFHLYYTAAIFTILNLFVLYIRIKAENKALSIQ